MAGELILQSGFSRPYLLNDTNEKQIKARCLIKPSDEVRIELGKVASNQGVDLCIVLDVSISMDAYLDITGRVRTGNFVKDEYGNDVPTFRGGRSRLDVAIDSAKNIISMVRDIDNISCIIYSDNPSILFKNCPGNKKDYMKDMMDTICRARSKTGNNTNISSAIRAARNILVNNDDIKSKKILFLTDGVPTVDTEEDGIREGEYLADYDISIDCLGLGKDVKLSYLETIAAPSNGSCNFITEAYEVERLFMNIFEKAKEVIITNAKLKLTFSRSIRVTDHYRGTPENVYLGKIKLDDERSCEINLGQIEKNQGYNYYFMMTIAPQPGYSGSLRIAKAELEYKIPALYGNKILSVSQNLMIEFGDNEKLSKTRNGKIESEYLLVEVKKLEREALEAESKKQHPIVIDRYQKIISIYRNLNNTVEARAYENVLEKYQREGKIPFEELNKATNSSSKLGDSGQLQPLDMPEYDAFVRVKRGRR